MSNDNDDSGKSPKDTRFQSGVSGNPKGRPKKKSAAIAECINDSLNAPMPYREKGRLKQASRYEVGLRKQRDLAVAGNVDAALFLLKARAHALRCGNIGVEQIQIEDWLPDHPGQTAEEKTQAFAASGEAQSQAWPQANDDDDDSQND